MANKIKGITIEIGGDTKKLDKALSGTNKTISTTQKELKAVEKALKMDPGNTELLEQKQRLLANAVSATSEKLKTLEEAAKTADDALSRGKAYEAKYAPLKQEIDEVSASLKGLQANQERMEQDLASGKISTETYNNFRKSVYETTQTLDALKKKQKEVEAEFSGTRISQAQYDALQRELVETKEAAKDAEKALDDFSVAGSKISATAGNIADGAGKVQNATKGISTAATGILTAAFATVPATEELRTSLSMLENNARQAGVGLDATKKAFEDLYVVSGETDSSVEAVSNLLQAGFTESNLQKAVEGLANAATTFPDTIKIESLADSLQETIATGEATGQFAEFLDRVGISAESFSESLALCTDETQRQELALSTLVNGPLAGAYEGWRKNNEGLVQNRESTIRFQESMAVLAETVQPFLTSLVELGTKILNFFNSLPGPVQTAIGVILLLVAAISPIAGIISAIAIVAGKAGAAMSSWLPIIIAVTAALVALAAIIALVNGGGDKPKTTSSQRGGGFSARSISLDPDDVPHLASGGVAKKNNPFLAVVGDNTQEDEIIAPYSLVKRAAAQGVAESGMLRGGHTTQNATMSLDGRTFARLIFPYIQAESRRLGVKIST